jgi:glucose-6-phosphate-specific signal transduction histidine kinase
MGGVLKFNSKYLVWAVAFFVIEILIAFYIHDRIIRPYIGDFLVVILIYCLVKAFFNFSVKQTAIGVLLFSYGVEILQYFKVVELLDLQGSKLARIIIGTSFEWMDMVAYTAGIGLVLVIEIRNTKKS